MQFAARITKPDHCKSIYDLRLRISKTMFPDDDLEIAHKASVGNREFCEFILATVLPLSLVCLFLLGVLQCPALSLSAEANPKDSVVLIYHSKSDKLPFASGFMAGFRSGTENKTDDIAYLITNKHVIANCKSLYLRFNLKNEGINWLQLTLDPPHVISSKRPEVDLVAIEILVPNKWHSTLDVSSILDDDQMKSLQIVEGADVYTVGWTTGRLNEQTTRQPLAVQSILRFGKISLLTNQHWYNARDPNLYEQAYVVDIQTSNGWGFSGCPLLLQDQSLRNQNGSRSQPRKSTATLIGVIKGHSLTNAPVCYEDSQRSVMFVQIPDGLAMVEPSANLRELMNTIRSVKK